jgi:DNA-binding beta-propeller fold protein YncE
MPFGVVTAGRDTSFASLDGRSAERFRPAGPGQSSPLWRLPVIAPPASGSVEVFRDRGSRRPSPVRRIPVGPQPDGEAVTRDGRYLLVASGTGAAVISVARAERDRPAAVLGRLASPAASASAIEVAVSPDGRFAFVSIEYSSQIAVFNLHRALASHLARSGYAGSIRTGFEPVGLAVSPGGRWLYATSEQASAGTQQGTLAVISLHRAETDPAAAVVSTVTAGCNPVRVITSADGRVVWVTARASDELLGFSAARLVTSPGRSLIAAVGVGELPVGLALVDHGRRIVVADSAAFLAPGASPGLAVVDVAAALSRKPALAGYLRAGDYPRQMSLEPGGRILIVTNFDSRQLEAVDVARLP